MKKLLTAILILVSMVAQAQFVTIPDFNFRQKLFQLYPSCFNSSGQLDTTCPSIVSALSLIVPNENISNLDGVQYFDSLIILSCESNNLTTLPPIANTIKEFSCSNNNLLSLPSLPDSLMNLYCDSNQLASLPTLPDSLEFLNCSYNGLTSLPLLSNKLSSIFCNNNQLVLLPPLPQSLNALYCDNNPLPSLPNLPNSLSSLSCRYNQLTTLPPLPNSLIQLNCTNNQLSSLPTLPNSLTYLNCSSNKIDSLPFLPNSLQDLQCTYNNLFSLPSLPNGLTYLSCEQNKLLELPTLPSTLLELWCGFNQLLRLPSMPSGLIKLRCGANPLISCLPLLPNTLTLLITASSGISCLPNALPNLNPPSALPLCSANTLCEPNPTLSGLVYHDANNNNIYDTIIDTRIPGWTLSNTNGWISSTSQEGEYIVRLDSGVANSISLNVPYSNSTAAPINYSITPNSQGSQGSSFDFAVHMPANFQDLRVDLASGPARPGFNQWVGVTVRNLGSVHMTNATLKLVVPNTFIFQNANPAISIQVGDTLIWNNLNIRMFEKQQFTIAWNVPASMGIGNPFQIIGKVEPTANDITVLNNETITPIITQGAHDPNDKTVNTKIITNSNLGNELIYTIRFQNTGTDTAFNIVVRDTLSNKLDLSSFVMIGASHDYQFELRDKGLLEVVFPKVLLPDSNINEPASHGYFQFSIKAKSNMQLGDSINNSAAIYFDFNAPIFTNTVHSSMTYPDGIINMESLDASIFPNPTKGKITVRMNEEKGILAITDINGREIETLEIKNGSTLNLKNYPTGIYVCRIQTSLGVFVMKLVLMD